MAAILQKMFEIYFLNESQYAVLNCSEFVPSINSNPALAR